MSSRKPQITDTTTLIETDIFRIEKINLTFANGNRRTYERVAPACKLHRAVLIVPMPDDDTILLVKEFGWR